MVTVRGREQVYENQANEAITCLTLLLTTQSTLDVATLKPRSFAFDINDAGYGYGRQQLRAAWPRVGKHRDVGRAAVCPGPRFAAWRAR